MSSELQIGQIITAEMGRDAIHVAIIPCEATSVLNPGDHVGLVVDTNPLCPQVEKSAKNKIGIIDPYLKTSVYPKQKCWLFLYPNTVTSLRHEWTHKAFNFTNEVTDLEFSKKWLQEYAVKMNSYETNPKLAYESLVSGLQSGEILAWGSDLHSFSELEDAEELRRHAEKVLGIKINWDDFQFSCSC